MELWAGSSLWAHLMGEALFFPGFSRHTCFSSLHQWAVLKDRLVPPLAARLALPQWGDASCERTAGISSLPFLCCCGLSWTQLLPLRPFPTNLPQKEFSQSAYLQTLPRLLCLSVIPPQCVDKGNQVNFQLLWLNLTLVSVFLVHPHCFPVTKTLTCTIICSLSQCF